MKSILLNDFLNNLIATITRFPSAIIACIAFSVQLWSLEHPVPFSITLIAVFFASIGLQLGIESRWTLSTFFRKIGACIVVFLISTGIFFYLKSQEAPTILCFLIAFISFALAAGFLRREFDHRAMQQFLSRVGIGLLLSGLISFLLVAGGILFMLSLQYLFDVDNTSVGIARILLLAASVIWPLLTMMQIPKEFCLPKDLPGKSSFVVVVESLMSSLWMAFALVINFYALKIGITQTLPRGKASIFVVILFFWGYFTYFLVSHAEYSTSLASRLLRKVFGYALLLPSVLMGVAVITRIEEYGLTPSRYFACLFFLVFAVTLFFTLFISKQNSIRLFVCTLGLSFLVATVPGLTPLDLSVRNQHARLRALLEKNEVLKGEKLSSHHPPIPTKDIEKINAALYYLDLCDLSNWQKSCLVEGFSKFEIVNALGIGDGKL